MSKKKAMIIGAAPIGLTSAFQLLDKTDTWPAIYEITDDIRAISKTINYKGNWIDVEGHRFFSKSDRVMRWRDNISLLQGVPSKDDLILGRHVSVSKIKNSADSEKSDHIMLIRRCLSRIFSLSKFFN
jgi:hypothetical protein